MKDLKTEITLVVDQVINDSKSYIQKTNQVYQKYLQRRIIAKDSQDPKEELAKAKRIFEDELRAC